MWPCKQAKLETTDTGLIRITRQHAVSKLIMLTSPPQCWSIPHPGESYAYLLDLLTSVHWWTHNGHPMTMAAIIKAEVLNHSYCYLLVGWLMTSLGSRCLGWWYSRRIHEEHSHGARIWAWPSQVLACEAHLSGHLSLQPDRSKHPWWMWTIWALIWWAARSPYQGACSQCQPNILPRNSSCDMHRLLSSGLISCNLCSLTDFTILSILITASAHGLALMGRSVRGFRCIATIARSVHYYFNMECILL